MHKKDLTHIPHSPVEHFKLYFYGAILKIIDGVAALYESYQTALEKHPFLVGYHNELASLGLEGLTTEQAPIWWKEALTSWESQSDTVLPIRRLIHTCDIGYEGMVMIMCVGLVEEDGRFGQLFESILGSSVQRPTIGLLQEWFSTAGFHTETKPLLHRLLDAKIIEPVNSEAPWAQRMLHINQTLWRLIQGEQIGTLDEAIQYHSVDTSLTLEQLILSPDVNEKALLCTRLVQDKKLDILIFRGPEKNGRKTLAASIARSAGCGILEFNTTDTFEINRSGLYATLLNAIPLYTVLIGPGETFCIEPLRWYNGPVFFVIGRYGGIRYKYQAVIETISLDLPSPELRQRHWTSMTGNSTIPPELETMRISSGLVRDLAKSLPIYSTLSNKEQPCGSDLRKARSIWSAPALESYATYVEPFGTWDDIAAEQSTKYELQLLEDRCRLRETMMIEAGPVLRQQMNAGVRALLSGPSGTGKTLSARILASVLGKELYRVDLSAIVNKYIGETEKNLNRLLTLSEEHDVVLLIDEGDALLTGRTAVQTSNDRYANLETNFLLQRLEHYEGICAITTNASERIDSAFMRRMDVIINFRIPDSSERKSIWNIHLDRASFRDPFVTEIASRCALTGGQIRNAVIHATLLALRSGVSLNENHLEAAIKREYWKIGAICPLR